MANSNGQNQYPGYGHPPPPGYGYPQAPPNHPGATPYPGMPGPAYGGPPMMGPPPGQPSGSSRTLPIIVASGLALGVFGGLMIVLGTGNSRAEESPVAATLDAAPVAQAVVDAAARDAAGAAAAPVDAAPPPPAVRKVMVTLDVLPEEADITIDGQPVEGAEYELELPQGESRKIKIRATADGYKPRVIPERITGDTTVKIRLPRRQSGGSDSNTRRPPPDNVIIDLP